MIIPSVGRVVLVCDEGGNETCGLVIRVWSDSCVNVMVMGDGNSADPYALTSVTLGEEGQRRSWRWMEYQLQKAAEQAAEG